MTTANPFLALLPEIWAIIHRFIVTWSDAESRVALQRTCKAAYSIDPGLILASGWLLPWDEADKSIERKIAVLGMLREMTQNGLWQRSWFPSPDHINFEEWSYSDEEVPNRWYLLLKWDLTPLAEAYLDYDPSEPPENRWTLEVEYVTNGTVLFVRATTLKKLLKACPMLCFGVSEELLHIRASENDLESLFVRRKYRTGNDNYLH
jgi:hypothetical protein